MTTLLPTSQSTGVEAYEDMFKEITRKLYGDESAHGLYPHNTQVAQLAPGAPTAPPDVGERSFTTLTQIGYETTTVGSTNSASSTAAAAAAAAQQQQQQQEHITTAFGLAALMQNGFPPPSAILNPVNFPNTSKTPTNISIPSTDDRWQSQTSAEEPWNGGKHASATNYGKSHKKPKTEPQDAISPAGLNIPSTVDRANKGSSFGNATLPSGSANVIKRYSCTSCPYTTDRRDLFTRHENIHKDEKPFQCYACLKPFNRADHVKKHFLRMHRELEYDIVKTRRHPPSGSAGTKSSYYGGSSTHTSNAGSSSSSSTTAAMTLAQMQLNIPTGSFSAAPSLVVPSHTHESSSSSSTNLNISHTSQLLHIQNHHHHHHHHHHQQPQQQAHNNVHPSSQLSVISPVSIKHEKCSIPRTSGTLGLNASANSSGVSVDQKPLIKKIKGEKKFSCTYCPWAGADNWGLKRHLNTHIKPYVCLLCDYKAARSERLATHVLKVHNKKACSKCNFLAEDQAQLDAHLQEVHSHDVTKAGKGTGSASTGGTGSTGSSGSSNCGSSSTLHHATAAASTAGDSNGNVLRNLGNAFTSNNLPTNIPTSGNGFGNGTSNGQYHSADIHHATTGNVLTNSNAANLIETINQHVLATAGQAMGQNAGGTGSHQQHQQHQWIATRPHRKRGPELLYSYLEADGSDSGDYARLLQMQAVGRNKASVTQDFLNAGGGDNGGHVGKSSRATASYTRNMPAAIDWQMKKEHHGACNDSSEVTDKTTVPDNVSLSLASLVNGNQLSFLQLLATAAVAHQQLQLHSSQQPQKKQQHQKPSKTADHHSVGASNGVRYSSSTMVSPPPAIAIRQEQQPRTVDSSSTNTSANGTIHPNYQQSQPLALDMCSFKKRRSNASSSDKENHVKRNRPNGAANGGTTVMAAGSFLNGGSTMNGDASVEKHISTTAGSKVGQHPHHHNNNNNNITSNKNINNIFDKMYKKPQNSFHSSKHQSFHQQQQQGGGALQPSPPAHSLSTILRTAPPSAVEEDNRRETPPRQDAQDQAEQFSLVEFLKNHTEVSISTVGAKSEEGSMVSVPSHACQQEANESRSDLDDFMQKQDCDRNPRKRYQPRRIEDMNEVLTSPSENPMAFVSVEMLDNLPEANVEGTEHGELVQETAIDLKIEKSVTAKKAESIDSTVGRLADIRDKHMIKLITNRRCCRICKRKGLLDHLDNTHYHTKTSLFLHTLWRHRGGDGSTMPRMQCRECSVVFTKHYKMVLHQRRTQHSGIRMANRSTAVARKVAKQVNLHSISEKRKKIKIDATI